MRLFLVSLFCLLLGAPLVAQKQKREPLTEKQQDQIEEAGIDPVARVDLYVKFLNDYCDTIKGLIPRAKSAARARRIDDELEDFAALMDELGDNLDMFSQRKADLRKSLKGLNESIQHWQAVLRDLPSEPGFELALKEVSWSAVISRAWSVRSLVLSIASFKANSKPGSLGRSRSTACQC